MAVFYDPKDERDLGRVKRALDKGGIEYFLRREPALGIGPMQVHVAEEDFPMAEKLLCEYDIKREPPERGAADHSDRTLKGIDRKPGK